ncbi:prophage tail fiber N-terminal domain-containing protein [Plesiomonas shigelloides]|uniref:prophage tail fiber N-terminal domain-containing protein n=1 Tax=Plesiomonas shigelloides TaxID=703 RepID=UPI00387EFD05
MVKISGRLVEPADDKPRSGVTLTLSSLKNSSVVLKHATYRCVTGGNGEYSFNAAPGTYAITVSVYGVEPERVGQIRVYSDSLPGDLNSFLMAPSTDDLTPEIIRLVDRMRSEAVKAAESAKQSQQVASKLASDVATHAEQVASNKVVVEQNTQIVRTKAQQVLENMQSVAANTQAVSLMRDEVVGKTSMAQAAADTATQKAASAAEHDAAAAEYARQAQEAAQATAGALIDGGAADLSTGVYLQPVQVSGTARPTFWKVTKGGTVGGVDYGVGDTLIYTVAGSGSYYKIDNTESVTSVQGEKGAVTLTPEKIGADAVGTAAALVNQHAHKVGAHPISGVSGLADELSVLQAKITELESWPKTDTDGGWDWVKHRDGRCELTMDGRYTGKWNASAVVKYTDEIRYNLPFTVSAAKIFVQVADGYVSARSSYCPNAACGDTFISMRLACATSSNESAGVQYSISVRGRWK